MQGKVTILAVVISVLLAMNGFFIFDSLRSADDSVAATYSRAAMADAQPYALPVIEPNYIPILDSNVPQPIIDAKAAVVYDMRSSRTLYEKEMRMRVPVASLTKVLSAMIVLERLNQDDIVVVPLEAIRADGSKQDLYAGERLRVRDLLEMMLVGSSNDAAVALAEYAKLKGIDFVAAMNERAKSLGMENSQFFDPAGLRDDAFSTAYDLIRLVRATYKHSAIWDTLVERELTITAQDGRIVHTVKNTDRLLGVIPNIIGGKTGYTDGALGCLILMVDIPEHSDTIISVVLGSRDRFGDTKKVIDWIKQAYRWE